MAWKSFEDEERSKAQSHGEKHDHVNHKMRVSNANSSVSANLTQVPASSGILALLSSNYASKLIPKYRFTRNI